MLLLGISRLCRLFGSKARSSDNHPSQNSNKLSRMARLTEGNDYRTCNQDRPKVASSLGFGVAVVKRKESRRKESRNGRLPGDRTAAVRTNSPRSGMIVGRARTQTKSLIFSAIRLSLGDQRIAKGSSSSISVRRSRTKQRRRSLTRSGAGTCPTAVTRRSRICLATDVQSHYPGLAPILRAILSRRLCWSLRPFPVTIKRTN